MCHSCLKLGIKQFNIVLRLDFLNQRWCPTGNAASILAPVKVTVERLHSLILSNDTKHA